MARAGRKPSLSAKQLKFIDLVLDGVPPYLAYGQAGYIGSKHYQNAYRLLRYNELVVAEIQQRQDQNRIDVDRAIVARVRDALDTTIEIMKDGDTDAVRLNAAKEIFNRGGFQATKRIDIDGNLKTEVTISEFIVSLADDDNGTTSNSSDESGE